MLVVTRRGVGERATPVSLVQQGAVFLDMAVPAFDGGGTLRSRIVGAVIVAAIGQAMNVEERQFANGDLVVAQPVHEFFRFDRIATIRFAEAPQQSIDRGGFSLAKTILQFEL